MTFSSPSSMVRHFTKCKRKKASSGKSIRLSWVSWVSCCSELTLRKEGVVRLLDPVPKHPFRWSISTDFRLQTSTKTPVNIPIWTSICFSTSSSLWMVTETGSGNESLFLKWLFFDLNAILELCSAIKSLLWIQMSREKVHFWLASLPLLKYWVHVFTVKLVIF